jgi:hypothetical protein
MFSVAIPMRRPGSSDYLINILSQFSGLRFIAMEKNWISTVHGGSPSHFATDGQSVSMSWYRAPSGAHDQIFVNYSTATVLSYSGALSDERSGLSFVSHSLKVFANMYIYMYF